MFPREMPTYIAEAFKKYETFTLEDFDVPAVCDAYLNDLKVDVSRHVDKVGDSLACRPGDRQWGFSWAYGAIGMLAPQTWPERYARQVACITIYLWHKSISFPDCKTLARFYVQGMNRNMWKS